MFLNINSEYNYNSTEDMQHQKVSQKTYNNNNNNNNNRFVYRH